MPDDASVPDDPLTHHDDPPIPAPGTRLDGVALGIDVGGTGVKAALVDLATARLVSDRIREKTPRPADPESVVAVIKSVVARALDGHELPDFLPVGCGLPGVVKDGRLTTAANIDPGWVGWPAQERIGEAIGHPAMIINDADAAGLAEMAYGAGEGVDGTVLLLTLGTGIGSALFIDGVLVPNTEFGHIEVHGKDAESRISGASRERRRIGWKVWSREFNFYLSRLELYVEPDLFILGGGVSKEWTRFGKFLNRPTAITTAAYLNASGIIGAAYAAAAAWHRQQRSLRSGRTGAPDFIGAGEVDVPARDPYGEVIPQVASGGRDGHTRRAGVEKAPGGYADSEVGAPVAADPA